MSRRSMSDMGLRVWDVAYHELKIGNRRQQTKHKFVGAETYQEALDIFRKLSNGPDKDRPKDSSGCVVESIEVIDGED